MKHRAKVLLGAMLVLAWAGGLAGGAPCLAGDQVYVTDLDYSYILSGDSGTYADGMLTLNGLTPYATRYLDQSQRYADHLALEEFWPFWDQGRAFYEVDLVSFLTMKNGSELKTYQFVVHEVQAGEDGVSAQVEIIGTPPPESFENASLFFDDGIYQENAALNLVNNTNYTGNLELVLFQTNSASADKSSAVAWKVVNSLGMGCSHAFTYTSSMQARFTDSFGTTTQMVEAEPGQVFSLVRDETGENITYAGQASNPARLEMNNGLETGTVDANIYKDDKLLATESQMSPGQAEAFLFNPVIWIANGFPVQEGQTVSLDSLSNITGIPVNGIASADIVITGNGAGPDPDTFEFTLENIVYR
ncbi:MAG: hypothetical protein PVG60_02190 [Desulfarculaceae bacterium]|jgi:hypothetical protein